MHLVRIIGRLHAVYITETNSAGNCIDNLNAIWDTTREGIKSATKTCLGSKFGKNITTGFMKKGCDKWRILTCTNKRKNWWRQLKKGKSKYDENYQNEHYRYIITMDTSMTLLQAGIPHCVKLGAVQKLHIIFCRNIPRNTPYKQPS